MNKISDNDGHAFDTLSPANGNHDSFNVRLLAGERVFWSGRPVVSRVARDVFHVRWVALYIAVFLFVNGCHDRLHGLDWIAVLRGGLPLTVIGLILITGMYAAAWLFSRTTNYVVTDLRCVMHVGVALTGCLSLPWSRIANISAAVRDDACGDIALTPKSPNRLRYFSLWPHVRLWRTSAPEPILRCVPQAERIARVMSTAAQNSEATRGRFASNTAIC